MAISTYTELQSAVANWLARSDLTSRITEFIALAESRIHYGSAHPVMPSRPLRIRTMETRADLVIGEMQAGGTSGGSANAQTLSTPAISSYTNGLTVEFVAGFTNTGATTLNINSVGADDVREGDGSSAFALSSGRIVSGETYRVYFDGSVFRLIDKGQVPLPSNYLQMRQVFLEGDVRRALDYRTPEQLNDTYTTSGKPYFFTVEGEYIRFDREVDDDYQVKVFYYKKFTALSGGSDTNWLLTNSPGVYLYGALIEAMPFTRNDKRMELWYQAFTAAINGLVKADKTDRFSGSSLVATPSVVGP